MSRRKKIFRVPTPSGLEDAWLRMATTNAIAAARKTIDAGVLPPNTAVGRLSDVEWGWIVASVIFGWIETRAAQATSKCRQVHPADRPPAGSLAHRRDHLCPARARQHAGGLERKLGDALAGRDRCLPRRRLHAH